VAIRSNARLDIRKTNESYILRNMRLMTFNKDTMKLVIGEKEYVSNFDIGDIVYSTDLLTTYEDCGRCKGRGFLRTKHEGKKYELNCPVCERRGKNHKKAKHEYVARADSYTITNVRVNCEAGKKANKVQFEYIGSRPNGAGGTSFVHGDLEGTPESYSCLFRSLEDAQDYCKRMNTK
jgi:hypothetical protein